VSKTLELVPNLIKSIKVDVKRSAEFIDQDMMMTDRAYDLVQSGMPFREAYINVKSNKDSASTSKTSLRKNSSHGSPYNLDLKVLKSRLKKLI
jgi:argininosuccinate lyase